MSQQSTAPPDSATQFLFIYSALSPLTLTTNISPQDPKSDSSHHQFPTKLKKKQQLVRKLQWVIFCVNLPLYGLDISGAMLTSPPQK